jgi:hypothetical protein
VNHQKHTHILYVIFISISIGQAHIILCSQDGVVGIMTGYRLDDSGVSALSGARDFLFSKTSSPTLGPVQPPIQWVQGILFPGVQQLGLEADQSPPFSATFKNKWSCTFNSHLCLHSIRVKNFSFCYLTHNTIL